MLYELYLFILFLPYVYEEILTPNLPSSGFHDDPSPYIHIFTSEQGIKAIESPLKGRILEMLRDGEMDFEEIVRNAGRSKSTVSVHLKALSEAGIIGSRPDCADRRKKVFSMSARFLLEADPQRLESALAERYLPHSISPDENTAGFFRLILTTIRISLLADGISIDPILKKAGERVGEVIFPVVKGPDLDTMVARIQDYWVRYGLGNVEYERPDPPTLIIRDCFECRDLPLLGRSSCAFDSGILSAIFSEYYGVQRKAVETHCYAMGSNMCRFEILEAK